ncbi:hypothetical protein E4T56_gene485 [Termitomyces sp. T112]|nr:hypothetical protein E4T56_gene485 [Termitomyces sp. T112]
MRLCLLPATLLTLLFVSPVLSSSQYPLTSTLSTTLVDALSNDPNYTSLLHLLQRARLIPTLNKLNGCTLFAPTNDAIRQYLRGNDLWRSAFHDDHLLLNDNVHEQLRQQLFYHLLNHTTQELPNHSTRIYKTLHYPRVLLDPPSRDPPPSPPWLPIPGGTLGGEPQLLRVSESSVGVDAFGKGGAKIVNTSTAGNGIIYGITKVLEPPGDLAEVVSQQSSVSFLNKLSTTAMTKLLNSTSELTLFLPVDTAWDALDHYERLYLESEYSTNDLNRILNLHAVVEEGVRYSDTFGKTTNLTTLDGSKLEIKVSSMSTTISGASLVESDIFASNGVLHLVDSLLVPPGTLQLTPEKYLLALNGTTFVSLLHSVDLGSLINNTDVKYTILVPSDEVMSLHGDKELPERGSEDLRKLLQYHFLPGNWTSEKLADGMLLETALEEDGLPGRRQVLSVGVSLDDKKLAEKSIRFAGAKTIGNPIKVNNTLLYFISRPLVPPVDPLQTALPFLDLSSFLAAIFSTSQAEILRKAPHTSLLIPHNSAFKRLGLLVSAHLLGTSAKQDLESVLLHHALDTIEYAQSLRNGSQHTFSTLEGSDVRFDRLKNGSLYVSPSGGWTGMQSELFVKDLLTNTGVVHELSDILIPRSVNLTIGKLVKAAQGSTMASLAAKAGFEWVLNGTAPPEGFSWDNEVLPGVGWTLLCPTDNAFKDVNLTQLYADPDALRGIVAQHLIPTQALEGGSLIIDTDALYNNQPIPLDNSPTYNTLLSSRSAYGDLVFRWRDDLQSNGYIVGIKGARGTDGSADWARVLSWGRSTNAGGGVIQIDRLLQPYHPPWWISYGAPTVVGVGSCILICLFFYGVRLVWQRDTTEATYEPIGGFGRDDDDD